MRTRCLSRRTQSPVSFRRDTHILTVTSSLMMRRRLFALLTGVASSHALSLPAAEWWLERPAARSQESLAALAPLLLRRVEDTALDSTGRLAEGRCLPYAMLLEMQRRGLADSRDVDIKAMDSLRDSVLDFAVANHRETWRRGDPQYESLGDVITAVAQQRGWAGSNSRNRDAVVKTWASRVRRSRQGCDAAFLFCAAAAYGLRIHVHFVNARGLLSEARFATPRTASPALQPTRCPPQRPPCSSYM